MSPPGSSEGGPRHRSRPTTANAAATKRQVRGERTTYPGIGDLDPLGLLRSQAVRRNRCDFCGDGLGPSWDRYPCRDFARTMTGPNGDVPLQLLGYWAACVDCSPLVARREWRELVDRRCLPGVQRHTGPLSPIGQAMLRSELAAVYLQLERHLTGARIRVGEAA